MGRRAVAAAIAVTIAACLGMCWFGRGVALGPWYWVNGCDPQPGEPERLAGEGVFKRLPATAVMVGQPRLWQPCDKGESRTGGRQVDYLSGLSDAEIAGHYQEVARDTGWRPRAAPCLDCVRLAFATKWTRNRCLVLDVTRGDQPGAYEVEIYFWPKHNRSFCLDPPDQRYR